MADIACTLHFRPATPDDAPRIQQLVQSSFRTHDSRPNWTGHLELASSFHISIEEVSTNIAKPDRVFLMAFASPENDGDLVASIEVAKQEGAVGRLSMIAVDDRYQRGGVGRQVLAYAENYCRRTWGVTKFSLNALSTRPALIEWYLRRGYRKLGDTSPFPRDRFPGVDLPDDMCFVELEKTLN